MAADAVLVADILLNDTTGWKNWDENTTGLDNWTPIGSNSSNRFSGTFDGQGHTISGIYINTTADYQGLFGYGSGTIQNVGVTASYIRGRSYAGGVAGRNSGTLTNCYNTGAVTGSDQYVGGVAGRNSGTLTNCYKTGAVTGSDQYVGGVAGYNDYGSTITNCYNTGTVTGSSYVGGVAGYNSSGAITNCYNTGTVTGSDQYVGGVAGYNDYGSTITNCYNTGTVTGGSSVGGVVGYNYSSGILTNCYYLSSTAKGGIEGSDIIGRAESKTAAQFASGEVCWLLNSGTADGTQAWYQTLGTDGHPILIATGNNTVYKLSYTLYYSDGIDGETYYIYANSTVQPGIRLPEITGYTYEWHEGTNASGTIVTVACATIAGSSYYAVKIANTYTITYETYDGTIANEEDYISYTYGIGLTLPTVVTKDGYVFDGWYENEEFSGFAVIAIGVLDFGDKTFYAKWEIDKNTALQTTNNASWSVTGMERALRITGTDTEACIYNLTGHLVYRGTARTIPVPAAGVYIVCIGTEVQRTIVK